MPEADAGPVLAAARALILAGRWEAADQVLASARAADPAERAEVALARAQVAVELRQWRGAGAPAAALDAATASVVAGGSPQTAFDLDLLRLFSDYWSELMPGGGVPRISGRPAVTPGCWTSSGTGLAAWPPPLPVAVAPRGPRSTPG